MFPWSAAKGREGNSRNVDETFMENGHPISGQRIRERRASPPDRSFFLTKSSNALANRNRPGYPSFAPHALRPDQGLTHPLSSKNHVPNSRGRGYVSNSLQ